MPEVSQHCTYKEVALKVYGVHEFYAALKEAAQGAFLYFFRGSEGYYAIDEAGEETLIVPLPDSKAAYDLFYQGIRTGFEGTVVMEKITDEDDVYIPAVEDGGEGGTKTRKRKPESEGPDKPGTGWRSERPGTKPDLGKPSVGTGLPTKLGEIPIFPEVEEPPHKYPQPEHKPGHEHDKPEHKPGHKEEEKPEHKTHK